MSSGVCIRGVSAIPNEVKLVFSANMQLASEKQYLLTEPMQTNPQGHINGLVITKCQMSVSAFSAKSLYTMGCFVFLSEIY